MKHIKILPIFVFMALLITTSCSKNDEVIPINKTQPKLMDTKYFKQNISLFDARVRSLNKNNYVRELYFVNLGSDANEMPSQTNFQGVEFSDDGLRNDLVKGDGIYTSIETFKHNDKIRFDKKELVKSVLEKSIVSPEFTKSDELNQLAESYELRQAQTKDITIITNCRVDITITKCCIIMIIHIENGCGGIIIW